MFRIDLMPAHQGDCLWIEYGDIRFPYRILVDGGTPSTYSILKDRIEALSPGDRRFEIIVITHIDVDHIGGILTLLKEPPTGFTVGDVWFNGFRHLPNPAPTLGVRHAEEVTNKLEMGVFAWNEAFDRSAIQVDSLGNLPEIRLAGGLNLILLSPYKDQLERLQPKWQQELERLRFGQKDLVSLLDGFPTLGPPLDVTRLAESSFEEDKAEANGSSIAILAEYEGKRLLLAGDAFASVIVKSLSRLLSMRKQTRLQLAGLKVSHHCSRANTSNELLGLLECHNYLISTNGSIHRHPDREAIARILRHGGDDKTLHFNYLSSHNQIWDNETLQREYKYEARFASERGGGISLSLD